MLIKIINQSIHLLTELNPEYILSHIEYCGRTAYKSYDKITISSAQKFIKMLIQRGHESVLEHYSFSVKFITNRAIANELVRHRLASYTQESTRYVNYNKKGISFIRPMLSEEDLSIWTHTVFNLANTYEQLLNKKVAPQIARGILPLDLATEIITTSNIREWRHIFKLRLAPDAHPQIRELMGLLLNKLNKSIPIFFEDITNQYQYYLSSLSNKEHKET